MSERAPTRQAKMSKQLEPCRTGRFIKQFVKGKRIFVEMTDSQIKEKASPAKIGKPRVLRRVDRKFNEVMGILGAGRNKRTRSKDELANERDCSDQCWQGNSAIRS